MFFDGERVKDLMDEVEYWKKNLEGLVSGPIAERENDEALNCWQDTDMQKWIFQNANEVLDAGPPTTLTLSKA